MEFSQSPLFKRRPPTFAKLLFFLVFALVLLILDARLNTLRIGRCILSTLLYPLQRVALIPRDIIIIATDFSVNSFSLRRENKKLRERNILLSIQANQASLFSSENTHLRALLRLCRDITIQSTPVEIQYDFGNPFRQKVVIGQGLYQSLKKGDPVVNEDGVVGQVTRVFPLQSEVTLITNKDISVPIQVLRTGLRGVIYGTSKGDFLDLRFVPENSDIIIGDELVTSGLDGIYPPGLPVANVSRIERRANITFAHIICTPIAFVRSVRQMLVLHTINRTKIY